MLSVRRRPPAPRLRPVADAPGLMARSEAGGADIRPVELQARLSGDRTARLAWLLTLFGLWQLTAPYLGAVLGLELAAVSSEVEVVDHVVPGVIVVAVGTAMLVRQSKGRDALPQNGVGELAAGACFLAGFWGAATHVTLVFHHAGENGAPWLASLFHTAPHPVIAALALWLFLRLSSAEAVEGRAPSPS